MSKFTIEIIWLNTKNGLSPEPKEKEFNGTLDELMDAIEKDMLKRKGLKKSDKQHANRLYKLTDENGMMKIRWFLSKNKGDYKRDDKSDFHVQPKKVFSVERKITEKDEPKVLYGVGPNFSLKEEIRGQQKDVPYVDISQNTTAMKVTINAGIAYRMEKEKNPHSQLAQLKHDNYSKLFSKLQDHERMSVSIQIKNQLGELEEITT